MDEYRWMDGWMDGWVDGLDRWIDGYKWMDGWVDIDRCIDG